MIAAFLTGTFLWVNLNSANRDQISALPNISVACVDELVHYRRDNGPFMSFSALGMFPCLTDEMKTHVRLIGITTARP